jgi:4-nitrophenyl phosphatase
VARRQDVTAWCRNCNDRVVDDWPDRIDTVLCDLDGVVWLAHEPIAGSVAAVECLRSSGRRVLFVTNNSFSLVSDHEAALASIGVPAVGDVVSSSMAAAFLVEPGQRVLAAGGPGVVEALAARGADVVTNTGRPLDGPVDAVVVGLHREFDYDRLAVAADAVRGGAALIGTNADTTYPTPGGLLPGGGSILAAIAAASGAVPSVAGKPEQPMADLVASLIGHGGDATSLAHRALMIGDRPETDGLFARRLGCRFALVRTGVTGPGAAVGADVIVDVDAADLAGVARRLTNADRTEQ